MLWRRKIDAAGRTRAARGEPALRALRRSYRYHRHVFLAPPWPEIYVTGSERRHGLDAGIAEYQRLIEAYPALGYEVTILLKISVAERVEFAFPRWRDSYETGPWSGMCPVGSLRRWRKPDRSRA
jgi:predicted ATPase